MGRYRSILYGVKNGAVPLRSFITHMLSYLCYPHFCFLSSALRKDGNNGQNFFKSGAAAFTKSDFSRIQHKIVTFYYRKSVPSLI